MNEDLFSGVYSCLLISTMQPLPMMHMEPCRNHTPSQADYNTPLYKTGARAGVLSTTGKQLQVYAFVAMVEMRQCGSHEANC